MLAKRSNRSKVGDSASVIRWHTGGTPSVWPKMPSGHSTLQSYTEGKVKTGRIKVSPPHAGRVQPFDRTMLFIRVVRGFCVHPSVNRPVLYIIERLVCMDAYSLLVAAWADPGGSSLRSTIHATSLHRPSLCI